MEKDWTPRSFMKWLFRPKVLDIPLHPTQDQGRIISLDAYRNLNELTGRFILLGLVFGVIKPVIDNEGTSPVWDFLRCVVGPAMILTVLDLIASGIKLKFAERNFKKDWERLHPGK